MRVVKNFDPRLGGPDSAAFISYKEDTTFPCTVVRNVIAALITIVVLKQLGLIALILQVYPAQEKVRSLMRRSMFNFSGERL